MSEPEDSEEVSEEEVLASVSEQLGFSGPEEELEAITTRMNQIREEVTADLLATWPSPWKNEAMVGAKVTGRLGSHKAFQILLSRKRELEEELGTDTGPTHMEDAEDPMGSYAMKIARGQDTEGS
jgi:hypothetical protein